MLPETVAVSTDKSITLPMVLIDSEVLVMTETLPFPISVELGIFAGSYKSVLIVPSPNTLSNIISNPNPSILNDLSADVIFEKDAGGSIPEGKRSPGLKNLLESAGLQSAVVHENSSRITPNEGMIPAGSDWVPSLLKVVPSPKVVPSLNV